MQHGDLDTHIRKAIGAHGAWKLRLSSVVQLGESRIDPAELACSSCCEFGTWLQGPTIDEATRAGKPWQVVDRLHREFHQVAGEIVAETRRGRSDKAESLFAGDYTQKSDKLLRALNKWHGEVRASA